MMRQNIVLALPPSPLMLGKDEYAAALKAWREDSYWRLVSSAMRSMPGGVMLTVELPPSARALAERVGVLKDLLESHAIVDGKSFIRDVCLRHGPECEFCRVTVSTYVVETFDDVVPAAIKSIASATVGATP